MVALRPAEGQAVRSCRLHYGKTHLPKMRLVVVWKERMCCSMVAYSGLYRRCAQLSL